MIEKRNVRDIEMACWVNRKEWRAENKTIVLIPGSGGDHTAWAYQCAGLKDHFNVAAMELPGHGSSGGAGEQDVPAYVEWVKETCVAFGIEKPVLVGHSLGAAITLSFAIRYPEFLSGIIAFGGGVKMPVNPAILEGIKKDMAAVLAMTAKIAVAKQNRERLAPILAKRSPNPDVLYGDFLACDRLDISGHVQGIKVPTLLICGTEDKMTPQALSESLKGMIPGAQLVLIPEAGHMVMLEAPDAFNAAVKAFVDGLA